MRRLVASACIALAPAWLLAPRYAIPSNEPDKSFTIESSERNVEKSYRLVEEILVANGFWVVRRTPNVELNESSLPPWKLPPAASPEKGVIFAFLEDKTGAGVSVVASACRMRVAILLPESTGSSLRELTIARIAKFLIDGLYDRTKGHSEFIDGYTRRNNPCISE